MKIRILEIDTGGEPDLNLTQVKVAQLFRACFQPTEPVRPALAAALPAPAALAIPAPAAPEAAPELASEAPDTDGKAPEAKAGSRSMDTDRCGCGRTKLKKSRFCPKCGARHAADVRRRNREGVKAETGETTPSSAAA
jgi:hypothetical protein